MKSAIVILFCVCAINAQNSYSDQLAAVEENFDNVGEVGFDEVVGIGEGGGYTAGIEPNEPNAARNYDEDSEVITGVTDSGSNFGNIDVNRQSYVQAPDQYESQSAPKASNIRCVEKNERYPVPGSCDRYIECLNGTAEEKLCPDGLRYNPNVRFNVYPCQYPTDVPCLARSSLQPAQPTADCPHQFGYFKIGDAKNCSGFRNCVNGIGYDFTCPEGLAFSSDTYRCEWPDQVTDCDAEAFLGFKCPEVPISKELGPPAGYRFYRSAADCQKYFLCIDGKPRGLSCGGYSAFDEVTGSCVAADDIEACPAELKSAAARSRVAEEQRRAVEEELAKKWAKGLPIISTVGPSKYQYTTSPPKFERLYSTVTPELYEEYVTPTGVEPLDIEENF
ncbi:protein obstructor-E isoform X2 [Papilio machaon]|uniref:protein obstructor-E isoform X2 n=1 Tax=Papilio machaon TaxID=76193 RepID=UPI001E665451|nr:protein obstructor-E isoform X2 [Papilio machaon]